jgi:hypothetical protein
MTVVYLGVLAGLDVGIILLMVLTVLLGSAMLMLLASASIRLRGESRAAALILLPATPLRTRLGEVTFHPPELVRACGATRAPPCLTLGERLLLLLQQQHQQRSWAARTPVAASLHRQR